MSYQIHIIVGNLGETPELREANGQPVTSFSVAVNTRRGENQTTTWYRVTAWNGLAETVVKYLEKGRRVLVEGSSLRASAYTDRVFAGEVEAASSGCHVRIFDTR